MMMQVVGVQSSLPPSLSLVAGVVEVVSLFDGSGRRTASGMPDSGSSGRMSKGSTLAPLAVVNRD